MTNPIFMGDLIEANGKSIKENNLAKNHELQIHQLVEVKTDQWFGPDGGSIKIHGRLWVSGYTRDCDGTPLYYLTDRKDVELEFRPGKTAAQDIFMKVPKWLRDYIQEGGGACKKELPWHEGWKIMRFNLYGPVNGDSLKAVELTPDIISGADVLAWPNEDKNLVNATS